MSVQLCSRCLSTFSNGGSHATRRGLLPSLLPSLSQLSAPFSTSPTALATKSKVPATGRQVPVRGARKTFNKKAKEAKKSQKGGKRPAQGERKALRKRVVLSNTNALEVPGLQDLGAAQIANEELIGTIVGVPNDIVDRLRALDAFKPSQGWSFFRRPAMLMRADTIEYGKLMEEISTENGDRKEVRRVLVGDRGTGKTVMLMQVMTMAMLKKWIVINIPDAMEITIAHTEYGPIPGTAPMQYLQPVYTANLLRSMAQANPILSTLKLSPDSQALATSLQNSTPPPKASSSQQASEILTELPPFAPTINLSALALLGADSPPHAHAIFHLLLSELKHPSPELNRPPLLFCLEGLGFAMRPTKYIDAFQFKPIHAHDFDIPRTFLSHLAGTSPLGPAGGMVLAATSESNRPRVEAMEVALGQLEQSSLSLSAKMVNMAGGITVPGPGIVTRDPFKRYDERVMSLFGAGLDKPSLPAPSSAQSNSNETDHSKDPSIPPPPSSPNSTDPPSIASLAGKGGIQPHRLQGLTRAEAGALLEYWARSGIVRQKVDEQFVGEKWSLAGGGIVGELERGVIRSRM